MPKYTAKVRREDGIFYDAETNANGSIDARKIIARREGVNESRVSVPYEIRDNNTSSSSSSSRGGDSGATDAIVAITFAATKAWVIYHFLPWFGLFGGGFFAYRKTRNLSRDKMSNNKRFILILLVTIASSISCFQGSKKLHEYMGYSPEDVQEALVESFRNN